MDDYLKWAALVADVFTVFASGLAVYVYFAKKEQISSLFDLLVNFTHQLSLSEVKEKIERLNEYNANDTDDCEKIVNIFYEIIGQIKGNDTLYHHFSEILTNMETLASDKRRLTEPRKRALVSAHPERDVFLARAIDEAGEFEFGALPAVEHHQFDLRPA